MARGPVANAEAGPSTRPLAPDITGGLEGDVHSGDGAALERFWQAANEGAQPAQASIRRRLPHFPSPPLRVQRVSQLDAELLDAELTLMLLEPVKAALRNIRTTLPNSLEPELLLLLRLALYKFSIIDKGATYGAMLQNLRYRNEWAHRGGLQSTSRDARLSRVQLTLFPALTIVLPYLHTKVEQRMSTQSFSDLPPDDIRRKLWNGLDRAQRVYSALSLANFLAFLSDGRYRTLTDRLLGMRLIYAQRTMNRNVSFEFLNRQLVWHAFTEFLLFLLPLIQPRRLLRRLMRLPTHPWILAFWLTVLPRMLSKRMGLYVDERGRARFRMPQKLPFGFANPLAQGTRGDDDAIRATRAKYAALPDGVCAICWERLEAQAGVQSGGTTVALGEGAGSAGDGGATATQAIAGLAGDPNDPARGSSSRQRLPLDGSGQPIQPRGLAARTTKALSSLGRSNNGLAYADAIVHTPYRAEPCGHTYCYVCLASRLLSDEAAEELQDTADGDDDIKTPANATEKDQHRTETTAVAWHCLRCGLGVRRAQRDLAFVSDLPKEQLADKGNGDASLSAS